MEADRSARSSVDYPLFDLAEQRVLGLLGLPPTLIYLRQWLD